MKPLYTSHVTVTAGRDGHARSHDGVLDLPLGWPRELGGAGTAANPEQLFVAGYAACFGSSIRTAAASRKVSLGPLRLETEATLAAHEDGSYHVTTVRFVVHAEGLAAHADAILTEAMRICAYSNATRGNVTLEVTVA
jgi:Ohr subfamily peroxiredoxin